MAAVPGSAGLSTAPSEKRSQAPVAARSAEPRWGARAIAPCPASQPQGNQPRGHHSYSCPACAEAAPTARAHA
eukprot:14969080-Alexandrium_andersonii.AAC.1